MNQEHLLYIDIPIDDKEHLLPEPSHKLAFSKRIKLDDGTVICREIKKLYPEDTESPIEESFCPFCFNRELTVEEDYAMSLRWSFCDYCCSKPILDWNINSDYPDGKYLVNNDYYHVPVAFIERIVPSNILDEIAEKYPQFEPSMEEDDIKSLDGDIMDVLEKSSLPCYSFDFKHPIIRDRRYDCSHDGVYLGLFTNFGYIVIFGD